MTNLKSYNEWNTSGYYIMKGQRAKIFNQDGIALFTKHQVAKKEFQGLYQGGQHDADYDFEDCWSHI